MEFLRKLYYKINHFFLKRKYKDIDIVGKFRPYKLDLYQEYGGNNQVVCYGSPILHRCKISFHGNNNILVIGEGNILYNIDFDLRGNNNKIVIGNSTYMDGNCEFCVADGTEIRMGSNCMLARNVSIRTTDSHCLMSENGTILNIAQNINIRNHVWLGLDSLILKGSHIPDGCVVGARSIVTSKLNAPPKSVIAGTPAKVIKEDVYWR